MGIKQLLYNLEEMKFKNSWSKIFEIELVGIHLEAVYLKIKSSQVTFKVENANSRMISTYTTATRRCVAVFVPSNYEEYYSREGHYAKHGKANITHIALRNKLGKVKILFTFSSGVATGTSWVLVH
jgi:hypothetical protein